MGRGHSYRPQVVFGEASGQVCDKWKQAHYSGSLLVMQLEPLLATTLQSLNAHNLVIFRHGPVHRGDP